MDPNALRALQQQEQQALTEKHIQKQQALKNTQSTACVPHETRIRELKSLLDKASLPLEIKIRERDLSQAQNNLASLRLNQETELQLLIERQNAETAQMKERHQVEPSVIDLLEQAAKFKQLQPTTQRDKIPYLHRYTENVLFGKKVPEETRYRERAPLSIPITLKRDPIAQTWQLGGKIPGQCVLLFSVTLMSMSEGKSYFIVSAVSDASWSIKRTGSHIYGSIDSIEQMRGPTVQTHSIEISELEDAVIRIVTEVIETGPCNYSMDCDCTPPDCTPTDCVATDCAVNDCDCTYACDCTCTCTCECD